MRPLIRKHSAPYWLHKYFVLVAMALLMALALTLFARVTGLGSSLVATGDSGERPVMGRGGQFEKPPVW
jgi:hypothetical protein